MGFYQQPLEYYKWSFKDKEIVLSYWDLGGWFGNIRNNGSAEYETLTISYRDLGLKRKKNLAEQQQQQKQLEESARQKQKSLSGII